MEKILKRIKQARLRKGLSQATVARRLNIVSSAYSKIERGQTELSVKRLTQLCEILGLNSLEVVREFIVAAGNPSTGKQVAPMSLEQELELSRKINYVAKQFINSLVFDTHRQIMMEYPYTEFTAEDWWNSLGDNPEEQLGMKEEEFWDTFGGGYTEVFKPEDQYEGFKKLMSDSNIFYFFRFGFVEDGDLNRQFREYIQREDTRCYPLFSKTSSETVRNYLQTMEVDEVYEPQPQYDERPF